MSLQSGVSTGTEKMKSALKQQPIKIKGLGFEETPYSRLIKQEREESLLKVRDFNSGILRVYLI